MFGCLPKTALYGVLVFITVSALIENEDTLSIVSKLT